VRLPQLHLCSPALTEEVEVASSIPAGTLADVVFLSCDLCSIMQPVQEVWSERPHFTILCCYLWGKIATPLS
jgi:hypothetical protein